MTDVLALDPGLVNPGVAWQRDGVIQAAHRLKIPKAWSKLEILDRSDRIAEVAFEWFGLRATKLGGLDKSVVLVVEWPQWYNDNEKGIDQNDLAGLCGIGGSLTGRLRAARAAFDLTPIEIVVKSPHPRTVWGNLPKTTRGNPWLSPRGERLRSRCTAAEIAAIQPYHDALDAAGLAKWAAGLWTARRVMPGAVP